MDILGVTEGRREHKVLQTLMLPWIRSLEVFCNYEADLDLWQRHFENVKSHNSRQRYEVPLVNKIIVIWYDIKYRVWQETLTIFKLKWNEKYSLFLCKFITKIIFNSKHFNYNIHFLNIGSVRWCHLLSTHSPKCFWKFCITHCSMLGEISATSSLMFCFKSVVLGFSSYTLLLRCP
jgi:hypothetical protein